MKIREFIQHIINNPFQVFAEVCFLIILFLCLLCVLHIFQ